MLMKTLGSTIRRFFWETKLYSFTPSKTIVDIVINNTKLISLRIIIYL
jgi:hypothetical protein